MRSALILLWRPANDLPGSRVVEYTEVSSHLRKIANNFYKSNANITNAFPY